MSTLATTAKNSTAAVAATKAARTASEATLKAWDAVTDATEEERGLVADGARRAAATVAGTKAAATAADLTTRALDSVSDLVADDEPVQKRPRWTYVAAVGAGLVATGLAVRAWRRRRAEQDERPLDELPDETQRYESSAESIAGWELPDEAYASDES